MYLWAPLLMAEEKKDDMQSNVLFFICVCLVPMLLIVSLDFSLDSTSSSKAVDTDSCESGLSPSKLHSFKQQSVS
jgi:hypothetical protein